MATINSVIRSYNASVRRYEREQQRKTREAAKRFKEQQKLQEISNARQAVEDWQNYVNTIQSLHKDCTEKIDWTEIENTPSPQEPKREALNEKKEQEKLDKFKPTLIDKVFGLTNKRIDKLNKNIDEAKEKDTQIYNEALKQYQQDLAEWTEIKEIVTGLKSQDLNAYKKAIDYFDPFSDISELGTNIRINFDNDIIDIDLHVNSEDVIPNYELKQTSTGKLSKKDMVKGKFNELYQDYICSSAIRTAREIFAILPIAKVRINAMATLLDKSTGYLEDQAILSVIFVDETINKLNLNLIDPSDSLGNFIHNMNFNKTQGFQAVEKVKLKI